MMLERYVDDEDGSVWVLVSPAGEACYYIREGEPEGTRRYAVPADQWRKLFGITAARSGA